MKAQFFKISVLAAWMAIFAVSAVSQELVKESQASFPPGTIRVEYSRLAKLRTLPNYDSLRQRYVGPRLRALEESFAQLGVRESDVNEVMLGWRPGSSTMELDGIVTGQFNAKSIADRAAAVGTAATEIGGLPAYCLGASGATTCLVVLRDSMGLFGTQEGLNSMLDAREGRTPSLSTNARFTKLMEEAPTEAPIWGVAVGDAVGDWFRAWLPAQGGLQMDWSKAFQSVESLIYSVDAADNVQLNVKMDCTNDQSAESTRQIFEGLRMFQSMAWQNTNPGKPNPFQGVEISRDSRRVSLKMASSYADLQSFNPTGG